MQTVMGHADIGTTYNIYGHLWKDTKSDLDDMAQVAERFSTWIAPGGSVAFVIGNKKLGDRVVPTAAVVSELFAAQGLVLRDELRHKQIGREP